MASSQMGNSDQLPWQVRLLNGADEPVGAGMLVDQWHVVTCAHVVNDALGRSQRTSELPTRPVMVDFLTAETGPVPAGVLPEGWVPVQEDERGDVAVLTLATPAPTGTQPARLRRPPGLLGHTFDVVGFPRGYDTGVSASGKLRRPGGPKGEWVELQATDVPGHRVEKGFSGAPVYDHDSNAVVGIVVLADKLVEAKLAWMLPVRTLATYWPALSGIVAHWALYDPGELASHWSPRARGVERDKKPGWFFTGRRQVLEELVAWLAGSRADGRVRVVTGGPGSGKSAVLARLVTLADPVYRVRVPHLDADDSTVPPSGSIHVAVYARGKSLEKVIGAIARATELKLQAATSDELINGLLELDESRTIVVDALDEAIERTKIAAMLRKLAADAASVGVRVLVATRPGPEQELLRALGAGAVRFDLDKPPYLAQADLVSYVYRRLLLADQPSVKTPYRGDEKRAALVADAVATRAYPTFLIAQLVSSTLVDDDTVVDVNAPDWQARFATTIADGWQDYLDRFGDDQRKVRDLLTPLAYAEGAGLPRDEVWPLLATALSQRSYEVGNVDWLLETAADYLIQETEAGEQLVYRLYHQALSDYFRVPAREADAQRRITQALHDHTPMRADGKGRDWCQAHSYIRVHLATHAAAAGRLDELVEDPVFLLAAEPSSLLRALPTVTEPAARRAAGVYRRVAALLRDKPLAEAAAYLGLHAHQSGVPELARQLDHAGIPLPWAVRWTHWLAPQAFLTLGRHGAQVSALALGVIDDRPVALSGGEDGAVRVWDLHTGIPVGDPLLGHKGKVAAVAFGIVDDRPVALSGGEDELVRVWDLSTGRLAFAPPLGLDPAGAVTAIAVGEANGQMVTAAGSWNLTVQIWNLQAGIPLCQPLIGHTAGVAAVTMGTVDGQPVVVSGSGDHTVRVWDLNGNLLRTIEVGTGVCAVALGTVDRQPVALSGEDDGSLRVWDLRAGARLEEPLRRTARLTAVTAGTLDDQPIVVSGSDGGIVRVWDLYGNLLQTIDTGSAVFGLALGEVNGRPVVVSGGWDQTVFVWDLRTGAPVGKPLSGHDGWIAALAVGEVDGCPVAVSASGDETLHVWDLTTGKLVGKPLRGHTGTVASVAMGEVDGRPIIVSGSWDRTIRLWDPRVGTPLGQPWCGHTEEVAAVALGRMHDQPVVVSGGWDQTVRVWAARSGAQLGTFHGHTAGVTAVAVSDVARTPVISGGGDEVIRVWDQHGTAVRSIDVGSAIWAVTLAGSQHLTMATNSGLIVAELMALSHDARHGGS